MVETLVTLAIFSILMAGVYGAFISQLKHSTREYRVAESEIELGIANNLLSADIIMSGYGLADDYSAATGHTFSTPSAVKATNANPDTLTLMGTAIGISSRPAQGWTYMKTVAPTFEAWGDAREDLSVGDRVILMEPSTKALLAEGGSWLFRYSGVSANPTVINTPPSATTTGTVLTNKTVGTIVYGLHGADATKATQPYHAVRYYLGGTSPANCAPGTESLLRAESRTNDSPTGGNPLLACVLDFQVALDLDTDENGTVDTYDNGGVAASSYVPDDLRKRLKQVRAYVLVQSGNRDPDYTYPSATVRVGDSALNVGRDLTLTAEQRHYRWRVLSVVVSPRNLQ